MVDLSKIKPGDEVTVRMRVVATDGVPELALARVIHSDDAAMHYSFEDIVEHHPKALSVGDRATHPGFAGPFEIIAIHGEQAWGLWDDGGMHTVPLAGMERFA